MPFHAAKDLVYTINGNNISSGGYRISKILNGKSKKKGKQTQAGGGDGSSSSEMFKEDSGIPVGLLLLQRLHHYDHEHGSHEGADKGADYKNKNKYLLHSDSHSEPNKKLVYASIMTESDHDDDDDGDGRVIELVITPSMPSSSGFMSENEYTEDPIEISSNEIDDELYDSLVKSISGPEHGSVSALTPLRRATTTKKQNFGKHKDVEKIFQKRRTRSKRHNK
jgi:hypothetical protein